MKRLKAKEKKLKRKRLFLVFLGVALFLLLIILGAKIYQVSEKLAWDGKSKINLSFQSESFFLASFDPVVKSLTFLIIPKDTFIKSIHGYGPYRVESLQRLGELEGYGSKLLAESFQDYLGMPVDAYASFGNLGFEGDQSAELKSLITRVMIRLLKGEGETNLNRWDLVRLWWGLLRLRGSQVTVFNLEEMSAFTEVTLPDGSQAAKVDPERLEEVIGRFFSDSQIQSEDLAIAIINGTTYPGLAGQAAQLVTNIGGRVVATGEINDPGFQEALGEKQCLIQSLKENRRKYTVEKLKKIFGCDWGGEELYQQRAEVVLILGEGYWRKLHSRS